MYETSGGLAVMLGQDTRGVPRYLRIACSPDGAPRRSPVHKV